MLKFVTGAKLEVQLTYERFQVIQSIIWIFQHFLTKGVGEDESRSSPK